MNWLNQHTALKAVSLSMGTLFVLSSWAQTETENEEAIPKIVPTQSAIRALTSPSTTTSATTATSQAAQGRALPDAALAVPAAPTAADTAALNRSNEIMREKQARRAAQMQAESMSDSTRQAWNDWSANKYPKTPQGLTDKNRDFLQLQRDWDQVQAEAHKGNISSADNSRFLREHSEDMQRRMRDAGAKHGLDVKLQESSGPQKTYSDVDGHGFPARADQDWSPGKGGELNPDQFRDARDSFNTQFNEDLRRAKLDDVPIRGIQDVTASGPTSVTDNPARRMRTDLMPITSDPACFKGVECVINPDGGVMYQDPAAVRQEVDNRVRNPDGTTKGDFSDSTQKTDYLNEQVRQQRAHVAEAEHLIDEGNKLINNPNSTPEDVKRGRRLLEQAQGEGSSLIGKYEERANRTVNQAANQAGVDGIEVNPRRQAAIDDVGNTRDLTVTQQSSDIIATSENAVRNQQIEGARVMAADGNLSDAAEMGRNAANPNTKNEILQAVEDASFQRHQDRVRGANPDWSQADIDAAARSAARDDVGRVASEMQTQTGDTLDSKNNRWDINENPNRGAADADVARNAQGQQARDAQAARDARAARSGASTADNVLSAGAQARQTLDKAGGMVDAAALAGQLGDAAVRQGGKAVDENRDLNVTDALEAGLEASGAPGMYALGNRISKEELIRVQKGEISYQEAMDNIKLRMAGEVAHGMFVAPVQQAFEDEWEAAEREGRDPSYLSAAGDVAVTVGGGMTGITQIADAMMDPSSWDERADAAAQQQVLAQHLSNSATQTDTRIGRLQGELESLSLNGDLSDPATLEQLERTRQALRDANDHMSRIRDTANRNAGSLSAEDLQRINAQARAAARPEDMEDYAAQNIRDRGGDDLADAFASAGSDASNNWQPVPDAEQSEFADAFASSDLSSQTDPTARRASLSRRESDVASTDIADVWAMADAKDAAEESARRDGAARADAENEQGWRSTIVRNDQSRAAQDQRGQQTLSAAQQQGQAALASAAAAPDPRMSQQDFGAQLNQLDQQADQLQQQRDQILTGANGAGTANGPLDPNKGGQYGGAAIAAAAQGNETGFDQRQAACDDVVKSGGNNPASITVNGTGFGGSATLQWDHYGVKDRIAVLSGGSVVFDSGCVPNKGNTPISVGGQIKVIVEPNCAQTSSSQWQFTVACSAAVAQQ